MLGCIAACSSWSSPATVVKKFHRPPFGWTELWACFNILFDALSGRSHQSQQPSFSGLSSRAIFLFLTCPSCDVKKIRVFYEPQFGRVSLNISCSGSVLRQKLQETRRDISFCFFLFLQIMRLWTNFDGLWILMVWQLTGLVLLNQSDYLSHSIEDSNWLIVACLWV